MEGAIKLKKRNAIIAVFVLSAIMISGFAFAFSYFDVKDDSEVMNEIVIGTPFSCPAQSGTCTTGDWRCVEGLEGGLRACEYECAGGAWSAGDECGGNSCYGDRCN